MKLPFVHNDLIDYLKSLYSVDNLLSNKKTTNSDEHIGYMKGARREDLVRRS